MENNGSHRRQKMILELFICLFVFHGTFIETTAEELDAYNMVINLCHNGDVAPIRQRVANFGRDAVCEAQKSNFRISCLQRAVRFGRRPLLNYLITELRCDVNPGDSQGQTALHIAARLQGAEIVGQLLDNGAKIEAVMNGGYTPLLIASTHGETHSGRVLLLRGASLEARLENGATPLRLAITYQHTEMIELLVSFGASIQNAKDSTYEQDRFEVSMNISKVVAAIEEGNRQHLLRGDKLDEYVCTSPRNVAQPATSIINMCPCTTDIAGEVCQCRVDYEDDELHASNGMNKVSPYFKKRMCWEKDDDVETRFYEDCSDDADKSCLFEDRIEICYNDDIDAAQALCRHFNKGDAYAAVRSLSRRRPRRARRSGMRTWLTELRCRQHSTSLKDCSLIYLPDNVKRCDRMIAQCWFSPCWQPSSVIRAASSGKVRYGQACKVGGRSRICSRNCFRCPAEWGGNPYDGTQCFRAIGVPTDGELIWE